MDFDDFLEFLKDWIEKVNKKNNGLDSQSQDFILLDKNYFICEAGKYSIVFENIQKWKNAKMLFVADNPGEEERRNFEYLFYDCNNRDDGYYRRAGYKFYNFLNNLNLDKTEVVKFNKCLISTPRTSDLTDSQIEITNSLVCSFIQNYHKAFPNTLILFSGVNGIRQGKTKFKFLYDELGNEFLKDFNIGFMGHISRKKFPKEYLENQDNNKLSFEKLKDISEQYKAWLFELKQNADLDPAGCQDCCFWRWCFNEEDDNGDEDPPTISSLITQ